MQVLGMPARAAELRVPLQDGLMAFMRHRPGAGVPIVLVHGLLDCSLG
jgi:hypothetical protein